MKALPKRIARGTLLIALAAMFASCGLSGFSGHRVGREQLPVYRRILISGGGMVAYGRATLERVTLDALHEAGADGDGRCLLRSRPDFRQAHDSVMQSFDAQLYFGAITVRNRMRHFPGPHWIGDRLTSPGSHYSIDPEPDELAVLLADSCGSLNLPHPDTTIKLPEAFRIELYDVRRYKVVWEGTVGVDWNLKHQPEKALQQIARKTVAALQRDHLIGRIEK